MLTFIHTGHTLFPPRDAIETIQREGVSALEAMQRDSDSLYFDLTILLRWVYFDPTNWLLHVYMYKIDCLQTTCIFRMLQLMIRYGLGQRRLVTVFAECGLNYRAP